MKALSKITTAKKVSLNNAALPAWPRELFQGKKLTHADLFRAVSHDGDATLPAEIANLESLVSLTLGGNPLRKLPDAIGSLSELEELHLDYCELLESLPRTIGRLARLRALHIAYAQALTALPKEIGALSKLEDLSAPNTGLKTVPAELWKCTSLRKLFLPETVKELPPGMSKLTHLEELHVSPEALTRIAKELPEMKSLRVLSMNVSGSSKKLPEEIGELSNLEKLACSFIDLAELPESTTKLSKLTDLDVSGNKLKTLIDVVRALPALRTLDYSDNKLSTKEKREIQALMKLPPAKRGGAKPKIAKPRGARPESLGSIASENAYLEVLIADAGLARAWSGASGGDFEKAHAALGDRSSAAISVGKGKGLVVSLGVGQGYTHVFRVGDRVTLAEVFCDDQSDPLLLEWIAAEPQKATRAGEIDTKSGTVAFLATTDTLEDEALTLAMKKGTWALWLEPSVEDAWGSGRRAHLVHS